MGAAGRRRRGPDFLVVGAQKAGTSWIHANLDTHPDVWVPPTKELHHFDGRYPYVPILDRLRDEGVHAHRWRRHARQSWVRFRRDHSVRDLIWSMRWLFGRRDLDWYRRLFPTGPESIAGEATPAYSVVDEDTIAGISRAFPDVRLVLMLRNPIERLWSSVQMSEREGRDWAGSAHVLRTSHMRDRGDYARIYTTWTRHFPTEQLFVGFMDDVRTEPQQLLADICVHLGVAPREFEGAKRVVRGGGGATIPASTARDFATALLPEIEEQAALFGGPARFWLHAARVISDSEREEPWPLPLSETVLFDEWVVSADPTTRWRGGYASRPARRLPV